MPTKPPLPPPARPVASHVQAALGRHATVTQAKPRVSPVAPAGQPVQPKPGPMPPQQGSGFRIVTSSSAGGPRQIRIAAGAREIGSVELLDGGQDAVRVVNLKVDPDQRGQGAGAHLMRAAAFEGMRMGKSRLTLESEDNGSGKLTRWYEGMGFVHRGRSDRGQVVMETSAVTLQNQITRKVGPGNR